MLRTLLCFLFYAGKRKNVNVGEDVNVMPTSEGQRRARGMPRKEKLNILIKL
jgi:hypothetical protein